MSEISKEDEDSLCGFTIFWRIENFNPMPRDSFCILSPACKIKSLKSNWRIQLTKREDFLAAYIFKGERKKYINLTLSVALLTGAGWLSILDGAKVKFGGESGDWGVHKLVGLQALKEEEWLYLPNGTLTISFRIWNNRTKHQSSQFLITTRLRNECEQEQRIDRPVDVFSTLKPSDFLSFPISYKFHPEETTRKSQITHPSSNNQLNSEDDLLKMFKEKRFSFVTLRTSTKEFSVHKAVLCAKSPVFNAMFERTMKEKDCNVVDIDDIQSDTMASLIKFLHLEPLGDLSFDEAVMLYYAADKYDIDSLRQACVSLLKKGLSNENICDTFILANMHQDSDLMTCAEEYFCKNSKQILPSRKWKDFLLNYTELAADVLCKLADSI